MNRTKDVVKRRRRLQQRINAGWATQLSGDHSMEQVNKAHPGTMHKPGALR